MIRKLLQRLTDTSDGGKHLPWITRRIMSWLSGFDADKYWHRQFIVANPQAKPTVRSILSVMDKTCR